MELEQFATQFRRARDGIRTTHESWFARSGHYDEDELESAFLNPLERLGPGDFERVLLEAVQEPVRRVSISFRCSSPEDIILDMLLQYMESILTPLENAGILGQSIWGFCPEDGEGHFLIELFNVEELPASEPRRNYHEEVVALLKEGGAERVPHVPKLKH